LGGCRRCDDEREAGNRDKRGVPKPAPNGRCHSVCSPEGWSTGSADGHSKATAATVVCVLRPTSGEYHLPLLLDALGLTEVTNEARNNRMRAL